MKFREVKPLNQKEIKVFKGVKTFYPRFDHGPGAVIAWLGAAARTAERREGGDDGLERETVGGSDRSRMDRSDSSDMADERVT